MVSHSNDDVRVHQHLLVAMNLNPGPLGRTGSGDGMTSGDQWMDERVEEMSG